LFGGGTHTAATAPDVTTVDAIPLSASTATSNQENHFRTFEKTARDVRAFSLFTLFGPLQTLDYATLVLATYGAREPRAGARARLLRRETLLQPGRSV